MTDDKSSPYFILAEHIAAQYGAYSQVEAVALAGSQTVATADDGSDIDMYVYTKEEPLPLSVRADIAETHASRAEVNNTFWEDGDEWIDANTGIHVDVMFRNVAWIEGELDRLLKEHMASVGFSTCLWYNVKTSQALYDPNDWFCALQERAAQPYPPELVQAIIAKNYPILRNTLSSYIYQLDRAVKRHDLVSINHRVAALLASYFDILFAINETLHPGEKRLIQIVEAQCKHLPPNMRSQVNALTHAAALGGTEVLSCTNLLLDSLDQLLKTQKCLSPTGV